MYIFFLNLLLVSAAFGNDFSDRVEVMKKADVPVEARYVEGRDVLVRWAYELTDYLGLDRTNVALAGEIFDRFAAKRTVNKYDKSMYFSACYVIATKFAQVSISLRSIAESSQGQFTLEDIKAAELYVCDTLRWKTYYPIPASYIFIFFESLINSRFMRFHKLADVRELLVASLFESECQVFRDRCGMASWQVAINCIIDAVNKSSLGHGAKQYLFTHLETLLDDK